MPRLEGLQAAFYLKGQHAENDEGKITTWSHYKDTFTFKTSNNVYRCSGLQGEIRICLFSGGIIKLSVMYLLVSFKL